MKLTRERKLYLAVLGLGAAALLGDRLFSPTSAGGAQAQPAGTQETAGDAPSTPGAAPAQASAAKTGPSFADRIRSANPDGKVAGRDPFTPDKSWPTPVVPQETAAATPAPPDEFQKFIQEHKLTATVGRKVDGTKEFVQETAAATLGKQAYRVGEGIDGFTLTLIDAEGVVIKAPSGAERRIDLPKLPSGRRDQAAKGR